MTSWRMDMAVLTDLASSMFAASFMILLIFLSLVQREAVLPHPQPVEAAGVLHVVRRDVPSANDVVELLRLHGRPGSGLSIDLFGDRVVVSNGDESTAFAAGAIPDGKLGGPGQGGNRRVRLYVFSNMFYNQVTSLLEGDGKRWSEMTVPDALRDPAEPDRRWSPGFLRLAAARLNAEAFRSRLAALLHGASRARPAGGDAGGTGGLAQRWPRPGETNLLATFAGWLRFLWNSVPPLAGVLAALWIERSRLLGGGKAGPT